MAESSIVPAMVANYCVVFQLHWFLIALPAVQDLVLFVLTPLVFSINRKINGKIPIETRQIFPFPFDQHELNTEINLKFFC